MIAAPARSTTKRPAAAQLGDKAACLARLRKLGIPVPEAFVLGRDHFDRFVRENRLDALLAKQHLDLECPATFSAAAEVMRQAVERATIPPPTLNQLRKAWFAKAPGAWIVRSSAVGEDSDTDSFAGQLDSVLDVRSFDQLEHALRRCWGSYWSARALFYQHARGRRLAGMGVVVQRMIDATLGGVLFTRSPSDPDAQLIEYVHGHPGELVAGAVEPQRMLVRRGQTIEADPFAELLELGERLERALGSPQDIEWVLDRAGKLWIVQSRPITARKPARQVFSNVNVNENYPRPLSPLLYSIATEAYEHYFRNLGRTLGVREAVLEQIEQPLRHCVGVHGARLYYNLSNIHRAIAAAPFGRALAAAFDGFVGVDDEGHRAGPVVVPQTRTRWRDAVRIVGASVRAFRSLPARVARFEARVDDYAARTKAPARQSIEQLHARMLEFLDIRLHRWADAALADLAATLSYAWLRWTLRRSLGRDAAEQLPQALLLAVPQVERVSAGPIEGVWALSRLARADASLREVFARLSDHDPEQVLATIRATPRYHRFCEALDEYLRDWGFRISGELMLTTESYVERPAALLPVIASYLDVEGPSPEASTELQANRRDQTIAKVHRQLCWRWRWMFDRALRATQRGIRYRERARLHQALLYCRLRAVVRELGRKLAAQGRLCHADDLLFLSWREIDEWLGGHAMFPDSILELVELRRRAHATLSSQRPPDSVRLPIGEYLATTPKPERGDDGATLVGVGVAGGRVTGVARVLEDLSEASAFRPGDCLVTRQTDPGWAPLFFLAKGLVMERGGMLSHGAIVAREFGIPGVIAVPDATRILRSGERIEIDGDRGLVRRLDQGTEQGVGR